MNEFLRENISAVIFVPIGLFFVIMTYGAMIESKKSGRHISGVPLFGGILIFVGFIFSQYKILSLLCLIDYGVWEVPKIITDIYELKRFEKLLTKNGFMKEYITDENKNIVLKIENEDTEEKWNFMCNSIHEIKKQKMTVAVCMDRDKKMYAVIDRRNFINKYEVIPFKDNRAVIDNLKHKKESLSAIIEIVDKEE